MGELHQRLILLQSQLEIEQEKSSGQSFGPLNRSTIEKLETELLFLTSTYTSIFKDSHIVYPIQSNVIDLDTVRNDLLIEGTTLVEYFMLRNQLIVWVIDKERAVLVPLDINKIELTQLIANFHDDIMGKQVDSRINRNLYSRLFAPIRPFIRNQDLIIVRHSTLSYLPFAMLWDPQNEQYLIEDYSITYMPNASMLQPLTLSLNPEEKRVLIVTNPGLAPQLNSKKDIKILNQFYSMTLLANQPIAISSYYEIMNSFNVLYFMLPITYNFHEPLHTFLEFDASNLDDDSLQVRDIVRLNLRNVNLSILASPEVSIDWTKDGNDRIALERAFIQAGVSSMLSNLWAVNDSSSTFLLYSFLYHHNNGMNYSEALKKAQIDVMSQEQWKSPYYWAGYVLTGNSRN